MIKLEDLLEKKKLGQKPLSSHYIPQFILREFVVTSNNEVCVHEPYYGKTHMRPVKQTFVAKDLYQWHQSDFHTGQVQGPCFSAEKYISSAW